MTYLITDVRTPDLNRTCWHNWAEPANPQARVSARPLPGTALPLLRASENPVVVNVTSSLGSFWAVTNPERQESHFPCGAYGASKAAVSMLTVQYAKAEPTIRFNAVEPGYTDTDFTAAMPGGRPVEESAKIVVHMAAISSDGHTGTLQEDAGERRW